MEEYLDLGPGELQGSLMVVQTVGDRLPIQSRSTILEKFRGQHQSLLLLKEAFEKADMSSTSFEGLLFSVESRMDELEDLADHLIMQEGSDLLRVSRFARRLEAFATDMGVTLSADWRAFDGLQDAFLKELANVTGLVDE